MGNQRISKSVLKRLIPLNTLSDHGLDSIRSHAEVYAAKSGTRLFNEGDTEQLHYYLLSGSLRLDKRGREVERLQASDDSAKFPIAHQFPRKFTAKALEKITYLRIDSAFLSNILANSSKTDYEVSEFGGESEEAEEDWMTQLLRSPIFQLIPPSNIQKVMMHMEEFEVPTGEVVIRQGEKGDYFFMVNRGRCTVQRDMHDGNPPLELGEFGPGSSFGEESLLTGERRNSTVTAAVPTKLLRLSKEHFNEQVKAALPRPYRYDDAKKAVANGAVWLDVREPEAFDVRQLPGSINIPLTSLRHQMDSLDPDRQYIICCDNGRTSPAAAFQLMEHGLSVTILDRGLDGAPESDLEGSGYEGEPLESVAQIDLDEADEEAQQEAEKAHAGDAAAKALQRLEKMSKMASKLKRYASGLERSKRRLEEKRLKEVQVLREALEKAHKQRIKVERQWRKQTKEQEQYVAELKESREEIKRLKKETSTASKAEMEVLMKRIRDGDEKLTMLRHELNQSKAQVAEMNRLMASGEHEAAESESRLITMEKELLVERDALESEISAKESAEQDLFELEKREAALREQLSRIEQERAIEEQRADDLERQLMVLKDEQDNKVIRKTFAEEQVEAQLAEIDDLRAKKEEFFIRMESETAAKVAAEEQLAMVEQRLDSQKGQMRESDQRMALAEQRVKSLTRELENMRATMQQYVSHIGEGEGDYDQIASLTSELNMVRTQAEAEAKEYREKISQLERELQAAKL